MNFTYSRKLGSLAIVLALATVTMAQPPVAPGTAAQPQLATTPAPANPAANKPATENPPPKKSAAAEHATELDNGPLQPSASEELSLIHI